MPEPARGPVMIQEGTAVFEAITDLLADVFVAEFQRRRALAEPTGVSPGGYTRSVIEAATSS